MTPRGATLALILILLTALLPASAAAADPPLPSSMAAVGDSITRAASTGGTLGADAPQNSWATGTSSTVNSHSLRLQALGAQLTTHNLAVSGAKMVDLDGQMANVVSVQPDYVTVLIGGNDLCTDTVAQMTSVTDFRAQFETAMARVMGNTQTTVVYVVSIPNVHQLWNLFKTSWWARVVWATADICQSLLANPTSNQQADVQRREAVRQRNIAYNAEMAQVCGSYTRCRFDGNAAYNTTFTSSDVSGDYFHPSIAGQAKLASVSWAAGYTWATSPPPNVAPTASFSSDCVELACLFIDTSTDGDGTVIARQWAFGDGNGSTATNPSHTYAAAGTYPVTLTVTDDDGATASTVGSVTVSAPEPPPPDPDGTMSVADLDGTSSSGKGQAWTATVTIRVVDEADAALAGATVSGGWSTGGSSTCTTTSSGWCSVTVSVNGKKATATTFTVTDVVLAGYVYDAAGNTDPDGDSDGTTIVIGR